MVKQFEHEFSTKFNLKNVVALNSGTSALELAYDLASIKEGDEVITPVLTCTATNLPLVRRGAKIVFADIDDDLNISIEDVKRKITSKTKAIVFVHFGGNNRGLKELAKLCKERKITLIEDAAQAVGSGYWGVADFTCVSLQAIKALTSGDGGVLITKKKEDADTARRLRWFGIDRPLKQKIGDVDVKEAGYKYHMNDISGAIGLGNLRSLDKVLKHRRELIDIYSSYGLQANSWLVRGYGDANGAKAYFKMHGIDCGEHHYRNDKYTVFGGRVKDCPNMDRLEGNFFFLPMHYGVSKKMAHTIGELYTKLCAF
jgi:perosamine synthetase